MVFFFFSPLLLSLNAALLLPRVLRNRNWGNFFFLFCSSLSSLQQPPDGPLRRLGGLLGQGEAPRRLDARGGRRIEINDDDDDVEKEKETAPRGALRDQVPALEGQARGPGDGRRDG